ncbi:MAG: metalloregulator ArsR/SmtB family transcription factor [Gammaproteobacteria bacterium]|nr:metalloregulator ArsR/SmtB family transcription factor [Gammaproteobacteria bacterium]
MHITKKLDTTRFEQSAALFGALSDPIRLSILDILSGQPQCACDIGDVVEIAPNLLSYHLKVLKEAGLIVGDKRGRWIDYSVATDAWKKVRTALPTGCRHSMVMKRRRQ